jgi:hypothetical protein
MGDAHIFPPASRHPHHGAPRFFGSGTWGGGASAQAGGVAGRAGLPAATGVLSTGVVAGHGAPGGAARYEPVASKDSMHVSSSAYDASALQLLPPHRRGADKGAPAGRPSQAPAILASGRVDAHGQADGRAYSGHSGHSSQSASSAAHPAARAATTAHILKSTLSLVP